VFPGGIEEESDRKVGVVAVEKVCALRELFEETGILVGVGRDMAHLRKECSKDASVFSRVYSKDELERAASRLKLWSVWFGIVCWFSCLRRLFFVFLLSFCCRLTPKEEKYRYFTTFYLLSLTDVEAAIAEHDNDEVVSRYERRERDCVVSVVYPFIS
jgi:8-oxo-dGTP pyrophosphatase MutT (NUDIX family)